MFDKKTSSAISRLVLIIIGYILFLGCVSAEKIERDKKFLQQYQNSNPEIVTSILNEHFNKKISLGMSTDQIIKELGQPKVAMAHYLYGGQGSITEIYYPEGGLILHNDRLINVVVKGSDGKLKIPK